MSGRFNEREFEFCFNAEFVRKYSGMLIGVPSIPSQRMENSLGYDIEFRLRNGTFARSLFLQHKVTSYVRNRSGTNAKIWNCYHGPYFRFPSARLDKTRQHNLLVELADKGEDVHYCAPLFTEISDLHTHVTQNQVIDHSRFFGPASMGKVTDFEQHHVSCDPTGTFGFFHSDAKRLPALQDWRGLLAETEPKRIDIEYVASLRAHLSEAIRSVFEATPSVPEKVQQKGNVITVSYILRQYFNAAWLILP